MGGNTGGALERGEGVFPDFAAEQTRELLSYAEGMTIREGDIFTLETMLLSINRESERIITNLVVEGSDRATIKDWLPLTITTLDDEGNNVIYSVTLEDIVALQADDPGANPDHDLREWKKLVKWVQIVGWKKKIL